MRERPRRGAAHGRAWTAFVPLTAAVAGLLFATSANTAQGTDLRAGRRTELAELVGNMQQRVDSDTRRAADLRAQVQAATAAQGGRDGRVDAAVRQARALALPAGLRPVTGHALTVTLDDAPRNGNAPPPAGVSPDDLVVHQQDVQGVVNALWAGGAEAMMLMDQRVISTSAVRCVGNVLLLQGRRYSPPYKVTAIGDLDLMRAALDASPTVRIYREYADVLGLGYQEHDAGKITMPAYTGPLSLPHATAVVSPTAAP